MSGSDLINFYERMPKKFHAKRVKNVNFAKHGIALEPLTMLIAGRTGSGKSNALMNLLYLFGPQFDNVVLCIKDKNEPLYRFLVDRGADRVQVFEVDKDGLPSPADFNVNECSLIVFDDLINEQRLMKQINEWFIRGRKQGCNMIFITQDYFATPTTIRKNLTHMFLFDLTGDTERSNILRNYPWLSTHQSMFNRLGNQNFLNVDIARGTARINFEPVV